MSSSQIQSDSNGKIYKDIDDVVRKLYNAEARMVFIDGVRLAGKTTFALNLADHLLNYDLSWRHYSAFVNRKDCAPFKQANLDIGQAVLFVMDMMVQQNYMKLVCERSILSVAVFSQLHDIYGDRAWILPTDPRTIANRAALHHSLLEAVNGYILYLDVPFNTIKQRAKECGRLSELESIDEEGRIYRELLATIPNGRALYYYPEDV